MGDFIKELTVIDFLGMIVPGSFLVLLFNRDYEIQGIWAGYLGNDTAVNTIILLVVGYLVGMLIHEVGDLLEKGIWGINWINPRYRAAAKVFRNVELTYNVLAAADWKAFCDRCQEAAARQAAMERQAESEHKKAAKRTKTAAGKAAEPGAKAEPGKAEEPDNAAAAKRRKAGDGVGCILQVVALGSFFAALCLFPVSERLPPILPGGKACNLLLSAIVIYVIALAAALFSKSKFHDEMIVGYLSHNPAIQIKVFGKGTAAKRQLFDGFYCVMRNFLVAIGIVNAYSLSLSFFGGGSQLAGQVAQFYQDGTLAVLYVVLVIVMLVRCWHCAFLKYKYAYEDYLHLLQKSEKQPSKGAAGLVVGMRSGCQK